MKVHYICIVIVSCLYMTLLSGCEKDWLSAKANRQQAVPSTLKDFQLMLNNEGNNNENSSTLAELASDGHYVTEAAWASSADDASMNAYTWSNNRPYVNGNWGFAYSVIFGMNTVLDGLKDVEPLNALEQATWNDVKGQALYNRADAFYRVAQVWAPPYNSATADADLGIPLRLEADITIPSSRTSLRRTYEQIVDDLLMAVKLLPANLAFKTRPSKVSAFALLARVYLSMREYSKAGDFADSCLKLNNSLLDYNELSPFASSIGNVNDNPEVIHYISYIGVSFLTFSCFIDQDLYNMYHDNDLRKIIFYRKNADGSISFKGNYNSFSFLLFCGQAIDEQYLIRAECYARAGKTALAMKDLNDLLRSRWRKIDGVSTYIDQTATDANDALKKILLERRKELIFRGLRWTDLRRLNFETAFKDTLTRSIGGNTYTLEPGSYRYTFPIPNDVISRTGMQQNAGW